MLSKKGGIMNLEMIAMTIVGNAGESKSLILEALKAAKKGQYLAAENFLEEANEKISKAHNIQTELICNEAEGKGIPVNLLIVHAQDHLMNTILAKELIEEMVELYKRLEVK